MKIDVLSMLFTVRTQRPFRAADDENIHPQSSSSAAMEEEGEEQVEAVVQVSPWEPHQWQLGGTLIFVTCFSR